MLDARVRGQDLDDVEPLGDPNDPFVASNRFEPCATASYRVAAVASTVCETPSMSWIVTRHDWVRNDKLHRELVRLALPFIFQGVC